MNVKKSIFVFILLIVLIIPSIYLFSYFHKVRSLHNLVEDYDPPTPLQSFSKTYDVIVIGGEPSGVAAAVSAARNGMKTLLIAERKELGGLMTYGMLNFIDLPEGIDKEIASQGIFEEWHNLIGKESAFSIPVAEAAFQKLVDSSPNLQLSSDTKVKDILVENNEIQEIAVANKYGAFSLYSSMFIDATQDAAVAAMANVPFFTGGEDIGQRDKKMAVTLMIHLRGVNWNGVLEEMESGEFGQGYTDKRFTWRLNKLPTVAWGFEKLTRQYKPEEENTRLRGLNIVKTGDDYYINALQIFGVDGLDAEEKQAAMEKGKRETKHILEFLQKNFNGFQDAEIASFPTELYVRETRHIQAEYQLKMSDVWENKDHWDSVGYGAYPVDVQAQSVGDYGYVIANPVQYAIPFRSLVPKKVDSLLVVNRSAGYSSLAAGSARIIPTGMVAGQAAGTAAAIAIKHNTNFREMTKEKELIEELRATLKSQGAAVDHFNIPFPYEGEWFYPSLKPLINFGLVSGGYENDLHVKENATKHQFAKLLLHAIKRGKPKFYEENQQAVENLNIYIYNEEDEPLTPELMTNMLGELLLKENKSTKTLQEYKIFDQKMLTRMQKDDSLTTAEAYYVIGNLLKSEEL